MTFQSKEDYLRYARKRRIQLLPILKEAPQHAVVTIEEKLNGCSSVSGPATSLQRFKSKKIYYQNLQDTLRRQIRESTLMKLNNVQIIDADTLSSAKTELELRWSKQLVAIEFSFKRFALRWRKVKLKSGIRLWNKNAKAIAEEERRLMSLENYAIKIQRQFRLQLKYKAGKIERITWEGQMRLLSQEKERERQEFVLRTASTIRIQAAWRGYHERLTSVRFFRKKITQRLSKLAANNMFGHLLEVQLAAGRYHAVTDDESHHIRAAHHSVLRSDGDLIPQLNKLRTVLLNLKQVHDLREERDRHFRALDRKKRWDSLEKEKAYKEDIRVRRIGYLNRRCEHDEKREKEKHRQGNEMMTLKAEIQKRLAQMETEDERIIRELELMRSEESMQRQQMRRMSKLATDQELQLRNQLALEHSRQTVSFLKSSQQISSSEKRLMAFAERDQLVKHEFKRAALKANHFIEEERDFCGRKYNMEVLVVNLTNYTCPNTRICANEVHFRAINVETGVSLFCRLNNAALVRRGTLWLSTERSSLGSLSKMFKKKVSSRFTCTRTVHDRLYLIHGLRNEGILEFITCDAGQGTVMCGRIATEAISGILTPAKRQLLHPSKTEKLLQWVAVRLDITGKRLSITPAPVYSLSRRDNSPVLQNLLDRGLQILEKAISLSS